MTPLHEMSFAQFAESIRPSGGMNRWPQVGTSHDVVTYSVSMNGDMAGKLGDSARDHEFRDVAIHALTEKLGLDPHSFRDNVKVAELLALRHAYLATVLDASIMNVLTPAVTAEYELVTQGFSHPFVAQEIQSQREFGSLLKPVLDDAVKALGTPVVEKSAAGVSRGAIVSQNAGFTVQSLGDGEIVVHENRRLESQPAVGQNVTVAYYRGRGQVIENMSELTIGEAYVEPKSGDLAVNLTTPNGEVSHVVMFNSMAMVAEFAAEHALDREFVGRAMEAREATPKNAAARPHRVALGDPYLDLETGSLAVDYSENSLRFTAVFSSAEEMEKHRTTLNLSPAALSIAKTIDTQTREQSEANVNRSLQSALALAAQSEVKTVDVSSGRYSGVIVAQTAVHVVQDRGRNEVSIHDKRLLDKVPMVGEQLTIAYKGGRADVKIKEPAKERGQGRA